MFGCLSNIIKNNILSIWINFIDEFDFTIPKEYMNENFNINCDCKCTVFAAHVNKKTLQIDNYKRVDVYIYNTNNNIIYQN